MKTELNTKPTSTRSTINEKEQAMHELVKQNLQPGQVLKSYRALCAALKDTERYGNSKVAQIKEWKRYFSFKRDGNKIIIDEIYDSPQSKKDKRSEGNNTIYYPLIAPQIIKLLTLNNNHMISIKRDLWTSLGMTNSVYKTFRSDYRCGFLNYDPETTNFDVNNFYLRSDQSLTRILLSSLSKMQREKIISYEEKTVIVFEDKSEHYATEEDKKAIEDVKNEVLRDMKYPSFSAVCCAFKQLKFYNSLNAKLKKKYEWKNVYKVFSITLLLSKDQTTNYLTKFPNPNIKYLKRKLNSLVIKCLNTQAENNFIKKNLDFRNDNKFMQGTNHICNQLNSNHEKDEHISNDEAIDYFELTPRTMGLFEYENEYIENQNNLTEKLIRI